MVQGVDVWMNNPARPLEASGTSGEKASMNGVMHFSVLDGWWVEGYAKGAGWALPQEKTYDDQNYQNELDAATIYTILENEIAPSFYDVDKESRRSATWIGYIKNTIAQVASNFTTNRMLADYLDKFYIPQSKRTMKLIADDFALARQIAAWKKLIRREWQDIAVISKTQPEVSYNLSETNELKGTVVLNIGDLKPEDIGVEIVFAKTDGKHALHITEVTEYKPMDFNDGVVTYKVSVVPETTGMYQMATRIYPKNPLLPHRQDFGLVRWI
jgi:phosphorylase/glycogen(starch) synthase